LDKRTENSCFAENLSIMSIRFQALENLSNKKNVELGSPNKTTSFFASNVFTVQVAREFLSDEAYKSLKASIKAGMKIDRIMANQIANGMRAWAETKGVTHFTHWFQPLTGTTAEKHDSFFTLKSDGTAIEEFDGAALIQQEPDASSFPSGGLRATFEARGYTAWDPSSPPFVIEIGNGKTLCIPTIFVSYTGESLDYKAPLLKATEALSKAATEVCNYFDKNVNKVNVTLGWEQEYFVIDEAFYNARPDLVMTGRTVFGSGSAKNQQLEDHYFGSIPERIYAYMRDFENESYKLGIPLRTRHNEVAPAQFECAPIFEEVSVAVDHNSLLMDVMDRVARRHNLRVLLHEKPFAGINGSGKHNNWSMATDTGVNLLAPGKTPKTNLMFLTFIHKSIPELLMDNTDRNRTSPFAFTGNKFEFRAVGSSANCANPMTVLNTIMAATLKQFKSEVDALIEKGEKKEIAIMHVIREYIVKSEKVLFEGDGYSEAWEKEAAKRGLPNVKTTPLALDAMVTKKAMSLFEDNGIYSHQELEARHEIELEKYIKKVQIESRIMAELATSQVLPAAIRYQNTLASNVKGLKEAGLAEKSYKKQQEILEKISTHIAKISDAVEKMTEARKACNNLESTREKAIGYQSKVKDAFFDEIRYQVDKLELLVDDNEWSLPKYREMLFLR